MEAPASRPEFTMAWLYRRPGMLACSSMRSRMAVITTPVCSSLRADQVFSWSGDRTRTSWIPPAEAWVKTGPRLVTTKGSLPSKAG